MHADSQPGALEALQQAGINHYFRSKTITYTKVLQVFHRCSHGERCPNTEQGAVNAYCLTQFLLAAEGLSIGPWTDSPLTARGPVVLPAMVASAPLLCEARKQRRLREAGEDNRLLHTLPPSPTTARHWQATGLP